MVSVIDEKIRQFFENGRAWQNSTPARSLKDLQKDLSENLGLDIDDSTLNDLARLRFPQEVEQLLTDVLSPILTREIILSRSLFSHGELEKACWWSGARKKNWSGQPKYWN